MHEHSEGHARQSFHVIGASETAVGEGVFKGKQKGLVACKQVRIYWMLEQCGGGRDHADEEKCQTIPDQAGQRHFGTEIIKCPSGVNTLR